LRFDIQHEIYFLSIKTMEEACQVALKVEEKLARKQSQQGRGHGSTKDREQQSEKRKLFSLEREDLVVQTSKDNQPEIMTLEVVLTTILVNNT
jgi:hypothetical protein